MDGQLTVKQKGRFNLALDSLTLYTNFGFKASVTVHALHDGAGAGRADLYPRHLRHRPPGRGLDDNDVLSSPSGLRGLFAVLTIVVKYLSLLLNLTFRQQKYLVESIEKLQK